MLNDQQIEQAARKLCELREWNPDEALPYGKLEWKDGETVVHHVTRLQDCIGEIRAYLQVQEAVDYAQKMAAIEWMGEKGHRSASFCPPPGPCACEHSFAAHQILGEVGGCRSCGCLDYVAA